MRDRLIAVPCSGCGRLLSLLRTDKKPKPRGVCETCEARTVRVGGKSETRPTNGEKHDKKEPQA